MAVKKVKPIGCEGCTRKDIANNPMLGREILQGKTAVIVGSPTITDDKEGKAFASPSWYKLFEELNHYVESDVWVYACPCRNGDKVTPSVERKCHHELMVYLKACGVETALVVGDKALRIVTDGKVKALTKARGNIISVEGIQMLPVYDYQDVMRDRDLLFTFDSDLAYFKRVVKNDFNVIKADHMGVVHGNGLSLSLMLEELEKASCVAFDLETTSLDYRDGKIKMLGLAWSFNGEYCTAILYPDESPFDLPAHVTWTWENIKKLFAVIQRGAAYNSKFDDGWLDSRGVPAFTNFDPMYASYSENNLLPHSLKFTARRNLGIKAWESDISHTDLSEIARKKMEQYCALDCLYTLCLREDYLEKGLKFPTIDADYKKAFAKILMPGTRVLERVEKRGVHVSREELDAVKTVLEFSRDEAKRQLEALCPTEDVNFDSPTQLRKVLYGKKQDGGLGYKPIFVDKRADPDEDDPTTGKAALKKLARVGSKFAAKLLEYRTYAKGLAGFIEPWTAMLDEFQRLYPRYNLGRTSTGRLSCSDPNLQQVSRLKLIRNLIRATPGFKFVEFDYSQIELRVAAWIGNLESMKAIYRRGGDIHINTAMSIAKLGGKVWTELTADERKDYRTRAKAVNFGFIYGMQWEGFMAYADASYDLVLTAKEAKDYRRMYFALYPELQAWHDRVKKQVMKDKYIMSPTGRVRYLPNVDSIDSYLVGKAVRCGINTPVQSFASDLTMLSMIDLEEMFEKCPDVARIVGQCHDAIFFEVREDKLDSVCELIHHTMTNPRLEEFGVYMDVPIEAEGKIGDCWSDPRARIFESKVIAS